MNTVGFLHSVAMYKKKKKKGSTDNLEEEDLMKMMKMIVFTSY